MVESVVLAKDYFGLLQWKPARTWIPKGVHRILQRKTKELTGYVSPWKGHVLLLMCL